MCLWYCECVHTATASQPVTHILIPYCLASCSTAGLLVILSHLYPDYLLAFLFLLILDFSSHWYHMYASKGHHKTVAAERNFLLRIYYGNYPFFGFCCVGTEVFYILLYVLHFYPTLLIPGANVPLAHVRPLIVTTPVDVACTDRLTNVTGARSNVSLQLCYYVCGPACVLKNLINVAQLSSAAHAVAVDDVATANKTK